MEAARSVTGPPQTYAVRGRGVWPAAPSEPTRFAGPMKQHMAEGGGFEPPEGVHLQQFSRPPQSAALPSLRRPISWRHENGGASGTRTHVAAVQRRSSPAELWPREKSGRSGGDRTRAPLLPKQVRYLCATLRCCYLALPCTALPCRAVPCHTLASIAPLCLAKQNLKSRQPDADGPRQGKHRTKSYLPEILRP